MRGPGRAPPAGPDDLPLLSAPADRFSRTRGTSPWEYLNVSPTHRERGYDVTVVRAGPAGLATAVYARRRACRFSSSTSGLRRSGERQRAHRELLRLSYGSAARARRARFHQAQNSEPICHPGRCNPAQLSSARGSGTPTLPRGRRWADRLHPCRRHRIGVRYVVRRPRRWTTSRAAGSYWASPIEARSCRGRDVVLVGGGTRRDRERSSSPVTLPACCCSSGVRTCPRACRATSWTGSPPPPTSTSTLDRAHRATGERAGELEKSGGKTSKPESRTRRTSARLPLRGADPATEWLRSCDVALDGKGFVKTGGDLTLPELVRAGRRDVPRPLETSVPGVFAIATCVAAR